MAYTGNMCRDCYHSTEYQELYDGRKILKCLKRSGPSGPYYLMEDATVPEECDIQHKDRFIRRRGGTEITQPETTTNTETTTPTGLDFSDLA